MAYEVVECAVSLYWEQTVKNLKDRLNDLEKSYDVVSIVPFSSTFGTNRLVIIAREKA